MKIRLILYITGIICFTLGAAYSAMQGLWISSIALALGIIVMGFCIWHMLSRQIGQLEQLVKSIQVGDLNLKIRPAYHDTRLEELATELDEGVQALHRRMSENEAKVHIYAERLDQAEMQAWQKLIRVLTHEIMNSITPIISLSETLATRVKTAQEQAEEVQLSTIQQGLSVINRRSRGLMDFVQNYRQLTRIGAPEKKLFPAKEILADLRGLYPAPTILFSLSDADLQLLADRSQLEQVLINLIKNAIEACNDILPDDNGNKRTPHIEVEIKDLKNNFARISVADNGEGIDPEVQERIFIPFFTTKPQGSGIGLALSRQIIQLHGGQLSVQSSPKKGSTFTIVLPLK